MNCLVTLYSTGCPRCKVLEKKLEQRGIIFETVTSIEEMLVLGFAQAPVLCVDQHYYDFGQAVQWLNEQA